MSKPLVLAAGRIREEPADQIGVYPYLRLVAGRLVAGGAGKDLWLVNGRMCEATDAQPVNLLRDYYAGDDYALMPKDEPVGGRDPLITVGPTPPAAPAVGDIWIDFS